jgi:hypothetical protein
MKKEPIFAHGLSARQTQEINHRVGAGDVETIPANRSHLLQDQEFKNDYRNHVIPMHERFHYHVAMENRLYNQTNRQRESAPMIQVFDKATWEQFSVSDVFKTYTSELVHNPELEAKDAPLVTIEYTLTDEEIALKEAKETKEEKEAREKALLDKEIELKEANERAEAEAKKNQELQAEVEQLKAGADKLLEKKYTQKQANPDGTTEQADVLGDEITYEKVDSIFDIKIAKALLAELTGKEVAKTWTLEKVKDAIIEFLDLKPKKD